MPVNTEHEQYKAMSGKWRRCRDVSAGEDAVHGAGDLYLPKLKDQDPDSYAAYVMRTPFYNATWRTIAGLVGMLFRKPPKLECPEQMKPMLDDVTMGGVSMQEFAQTVSEEALKQGRLGILVDYPTVNVDGLTQADVKVRNLRPMMQLYCAESIINWKTEHVNNVNVLTQVVLQENVWIDEDEFKRKCVKHWRVLDLIGKIYRVRTFMLGADQKEVQLSEVYPLMNGKSLDFIPFTFLSADDTTSEIDEPPLIDLVNMNLSHYRTCADLEHGAHFTGLPTPYVCGAAMENPNDKLYIGSHSAWMFKDPNAKVGYLEFTGQGLDMLKNLRDDKEKQMAILGARMLEPQKKGVQTAETESIHRKGEESMLSAAAQSISGGMTKAMKWFADWGGIPSDGVLYELNRDFYPAPMTPQLLTSLISAWQAGAFSSEVLFENLQAGEIISAETTLEDEQARLETETPRLQGQLTDPATGELKQPALPPAEKPSPKAKPKAKAKK